MEMLMHEMTHRQRVQAALDHYEPDLVPLDFGTGGNTSPVPEAYKKLCALMGVEYSLNFVPNMMRLAVVNERILQTLDIDTRPIYMNPVQQGIRPCLEPGYFYDEWGVKWREFDANGIIYREPIENPLQNAAIADLEHYPWWPDPLDTARYLNLKEYTERRYSETDYALIGCPAFNSVWERAYLLYGFQRLLESLLTDPDFAHAVFQKVTQIIKTSLTKYLELVGPYIEVVKMADDLGGQDHSLMSPVTYRNMIKPYHREIFQLIKVKSSARVFLHSCGSIVKLLPDMIDAGVEILNPVQVSANGMDTKLLKAEFGGQLTFWGAIDTQKILPHGSTEEVEQEVRRRISDLGAGGGYVVGPVHNVQGDVPAENVVSMYQYARRIGHYPLKIV
jgi:uroporphyrinogen decarboxylase